ncbi:hypothetical protein C2G38_2159268 [Gigaspora rosea]|uniref:Uncharacterized protein n=1 Tax=Gigaspora rosea TaxID=44941 RepID=A0A397W1I6_9GLOM|nr:hypothetical protein C2G38_2159268 [Gigaspora rosea]CAG8454624.1 9899_t:CDS:2 [Gigaspora rosea]
MGILYLVSNQNKTKYSNARLLFSYKKIISGNNSVTLTISFPNPKGNSTAKDNLTLVLGTDANMLKSINPITSNLFKIFRLKKFHPALSGHIVPAHYQYNVKTGEYFSYAAANSEYNVFSIKTDEETRKSIVIILATIPSN